MDIQMKIENCNIPDIKLVKNNIFNDDRGRFIESYKKKVYKSNGIISSFVQDNLVYSKKNVLRGLHYQKKFPQGKLVSAISGEIFDIAVDIRKESKYYGQWIGKIISDKNCHQLYVPPGFAHGYCVLSDYAVVMYKCTEYYHESDQYGIIWNDKDISIDWPIDSPILSEKDSKLPTLNEN